MTKLITTLLLSTLFSFSSILAQDRAPSPSATTTQKVGLTDITIEYSRPSVKGRTIFAADGLVPFGKMWRTGANAATKITFSDGVKVEGKELAAGSYAITTVPTATTWTVNFYPYSATRWSTYREADPSASVEVSSVQAGGTVESLVLDINDIKDYSANLWIIWEGTAVPVKIEVN